MTLKFEVKFFSTFIVRTNSRPNQMA